MLVSCSCETCGGDKNSTVLGKWKIGVVERAMLLPDVGTAQLYAVSMTQP
jgi:hypothetical protein